MQKKIASSDKPFYYDLDTIRVFIAGLNMSSISILQGISGTGKTSLPREFSKCIISEAIEYKGQGNDNTQMRLIVSVLFSLVGATAWI